MKRELLPGGMYLVTPETDEEATELHRRINQPPIAWLRAKPGSQSAGERNPGGVMPSKPRPDT